MPFIKQVVNSDPGTSDIVGGNDWDTLDQYFDDTDITPKVAKINTITRYADQKLYTANPTKTFFYITQGSAITANRNVIEPLLTASDTRVYQAMAQPLTNKTITAPILNSYNDVSTVAAPANPGASTVRVYAKQINANNDGLFIKEKINGAIVEVQIA